MIIYTRFELSQDSENNVLLFSPLGSMPDLDAPYAVIGELIRISNRQTYLRVKYPDGVFAIGNFNERQIRILQERGLKLGLEIKGEVRLVPITLVNG